MTQELKTIDLKGIPLYRIPFSKIFLSEISNIIQNTDSSELNEAIKNLSEMLKHYLSSEPVFGLAKSGTKDAKNFDITKANNAVLEAFDQAKKDGFINQALDLPNFAITGSLYPSLNSLDHMGVLKNNSGVEFSSVLSENKSASKETFTDMLIEPPENKNVYTALNKVFMNRMFLLSCANANSWGGWSRYCSGLSKPSNITWSIFLLTIGIHPYYKLVHREKKEIEEFQNTALFNDIYLNTKESIFEKYKAFSHVDLKSYKRSQDVSCHIQKTMDANFSDLEQERLGDHKFDKKIQKLSSVAKFLSINPSPSPTVYRMINRLTKVTQVVGINVPTWALYEKGLRMPHHSAWSLILTTLDIHPIYRTVKRTNPDEIALANEVYDLLHNT